MHRWLRGFGATFILMSATSAVFAVCEAEVEDAIQKQTDACVFTRNSLPASDRARYDCARARKSLSDDAQSMLNRSVTSKEEIQSDIAYAEKYLSAIESAALVTFGNQCTASFVMACAAKSKPASVASARMGLCLAKARGKLEGTSNNINNPTSSNISNQSQQNQAAQQQAEQDKEVFVTGPKEDCNALIQNPQTANLFVPCVLRNASRDKNAASASNASLGNNTQQNQAAQQQAEQAQQRAASNQARAEQARQGKRKTHDPASEAHECVEMDDSAALFGGFKNTCGYKINVVSCNYKPRIVQGGFNWSADFDCDKRQFGLYDIEARRTVAAHTHNAESVYFFACKAPASPVDSEVVVGRGIQARCN